MQLDACIDALMLENAETGQHHALHTVLGAPLEKRECFRAVERDRKENRNDLAQCAHRQRLIRWLKTPFPRTVRYCASDVVLLDALLDRLLLLLGASLLVLALLLATLLGLGLSAFGSSLLGSLGRGVNINQGRSRRFGGGTGLRQFILDNVPDAVGRVGIAVAGESG